MLVVIESSGTTVRQRKSHSALSCQPQLVERYRRTDILCRGSTGRCLFARLGAAPTARPGLHGSAYQTAHGSIQFVVVIMVLCVSISGWVWAKPTTVPAPQSDDEASNSNRADKTDSGRDDTTAKNDTAATSDANTGDAAKSDTTQAEKRAKSPRRRTFSRNPRGERAARRGSATWRSSICRMRSQKNPPTSACSATTG